MEGFMMKNVEIIKLRESLKASVMGLFIITLLFTGLIPAYASAQKRKIVSIGEYNIQLHSRNTSNSGVHIAGYTGYNGTNVHLWDNRIDNANKLWKFKAYGKKGDGIHLIYSAKYTNKVLEVSNFSNNDGANVQIWERSFIQKDGRWIQNPYQLWQATSSGSNLYLMNIGSKKYLDVSAGQKRNGANIHQWHFTGSSNQAFGLVLPGYRF
jgi:hypothetical protein